MYKTILVSLLFWAFIVSGCEKESEKSPNVNNTNEFHYFSNKMKLNDTVNRIVENYITENNPKVMMLVFHCNTEMDSIVMTNLFEYTDLYSIKTTAYFMSGDIPVFIYTGYTDFVSYNDSLYLSDLKSIIGERLVYNILSDGTFDYSGRAYTPVVWSVHKEKKEYRVNKHCKPPLSPPFCKAEIKFVPTK